MWVFASPGFAGIFRVDCKNRVKFSPAADLGDPAVGTVLVWSACMLSQSQSITIIPGTVYAHGYACAQFYYCGPQYRGRCPKFSSYVYCTKFSTSFFPGKQHVYISGY